MDGVEQVLDAAVDEGFLTAAAAVEGLEHSAGFLVGTPPPAIGDVAVDLGTGGGLPGLVLAVNTACRWHLVDRGERRCRFLEWAVRSLDLGDRVTVVHAEATDVGRGPLRGEAVLVTARGFAPPGATAECGAPLLAPGGRLVVSEPPDGDGTRWPSGPLADLGLVDDGRWAHHGAGFRALRAVGEPSEHLPRSWRAIDRSPRF